MQGDNHRSERQGDSVRFSVRPESAFLFYVWDFILLLVLFTALIMIGVLKGGSDAHLIGGIVLAVPCAVLVIMAQRGNLKRRKFHFTITPSAVEIEPPQPADGVNYAALMGAVGPKDPIRVERQAIREVVVRNAIAGSWSHDMALSNLGASGTTYIGVGAGGMAAAMGMATAENAAAGLRRLQYAISIGPRLARSYYVALRLGKAEQVIGGGLDHQGAADLAQDVLQVLHTLPTEAAA